MHFYVLQCKARLTYERVKLEMCATFSDCVQHIVCFAV